MADKPISDLELASQVNDNDLFVLQQGNIAKSLRGSSVVQYIHEQAGIASIVKTGSDVLVDHYLITFGDHQTFSFDVTNGKTITSVTKTGTSDLVDTYTIAYNDNTTSTFTVTNAKSITGVSKASTAGLVDTYAVQYNSGNPDTFTVTNAKSITGVSKASTTGLVDTYEIEYNDGVSDTFTVTNAKSITSVSQASVVGKDKTYNVNYNEGVPDTFVVTDGDDLTVINSLIEYGTSLYENVEPTAWDTTFPTIAKGSFLWTRATLTYSDGNYSSYITKSYVGYDGGSAIHVSTTISSYGSTYSLPLTIYSERITSDMIVLSSSLTNPEVLRSDLTVSTSNGSLTISGTLDGTTTLHMYLYSAIDA